MIGTRSLEDGDLINNIKILRVPYRVLSLDGGGMRGIYTAAFLARLTNQFGRIRGEVALDLGRGFDLITGTSTGAIVGCALAVGRPMAEIVNLYREHGPKDLPASHRWKMQCHLSRYAGQPVR